MPFCIMQEGKEKSGVRALPKLCVCICRGPVKLSAFWSQTGICRSWHQGKMGRKEGESSEQNSVKWIQVSCKAKLPLMRCECWGHKQLLMAFTHVVPCTGCSRRQEQGAAVSAHLQTRLLTRNAPQPLSVWEQHMLCPSQVCIWNNFSSAWLASLLPAGSPQHTWGHWGQICVYLTLSLFSTSQLGTKMWKGELTHGSPRTPIKEDVI